MFKISKKQLRNIKAQMTIFVILAFVIMIAFMLLSAVSQGIKKSKIQSEAKQVLKSFVQTSTIDQYIVSCIDNVLDDGIEKILLQGGNIYDYQGGIVNTTNYTEGNSYININLSDLPIQNNPYVNDTNITANVSYALLMSKNEGFFPYFAGSNYYPPYYPVANQWLSLINGFSSPLIAGYIPFIEGLYGEYHLSRLCDSYSECMFKSIFFDNFETYSLQKQLENYLEVKVQECVNFTEFEKNTPYIINEGNVTAHVRFSPEDVHAEIEYPVEIVWKGYEPVTEILSFNKNKNIRISKIYELAYTALKYESFDLFFDFLDYESFYNLTRYPNCMLSDGSRCLDEQITMNKIFNICSDCINGSYDDLIIIKDNASEIRGRPVLFQFMVQNRRPALDFIDQGISSEVNIFALENQTIDLTPRGYDPDSTDVWYSYSGWRETYHTLFRHDWYPDVCPIDYNDCIQRIEGDTFNWTRSDEFLDTHQNASYTPQFGELGLHNLTISIWDEEGLKDWQVVKILVFDLPQAFANGSNNFTDIGNGNASVEDPYILDGSLSHVIIDSPGYNLEYHWKEDVEPFDFIMEGPIVVLPYPDEFDIFNLVPMIFKKEHLVNNVGTYVGYRNASIELRVTNGVAFGDLDVLQLDIYECLPHVNPGDDLPYPYSDLGFQATHVCCGDGSTGAFGEILDFNTPCFEIIEYSSAKYFYENLDEWYDGYLSLDPPVNLNFNFLASTLAPLPTAESANDIYRKEFTRRCPGDRGNICNGTGDVDLIVETTSTCSDERFYPEDYRCYGPPISYFDDAYKVASAPACEVYASGNVFEEYYDDEGEYLPCRSDDACYGNDDNNIFAKGKGGLATNVEVNNSNSQYYIKCEYAFCDGSGTIYEDTNNCGRVFDVNCFCSSDCNSGVSSECDGYDPGHSWVDVSGTIINLDGGDNKGCGLQCNEIDCDPFSFNSYTSVLDCRTSCEGGGDGYCSETHICDTSQDDCVQCNTDHTQSTASLHHPNSGIGKCESNCGADEYCDEREPETIASNVFYYCNNTCQQQSCVDKTGNSLYDHNYPGMDVNGIVTCDCNLEAYCPSLGFVCNSLGICEMDEVGA